MIMKNGIAGFPNWAKALMVLLLVIVGLQTWIYVQLINDRNTGERKKTAKAATVTLLDEDPQNDESNSQGTESKKEAKPGSKSSPLMDLLTDDETWPNDPFLSEDWDPFVEMKRMREQMDQLFGESLGKFQRSDRFRNLFNDTLPNSPHVDLNETDQGYEVIVDLPGIESSSINVQLEDNTLHITAESQVDKQSNENEGNVLSRERQVGRFERTLTFPEPVNAAKLKTEFKNGVLRITVPKTEVA